MSTLNTTIEWESNIGNGETDTVEREVTVEFNYFKGARGQRDAYGQPIEPDEPPSVEITEVKLHSPGPVDSKVTEEILDDLSNAQRDHLEGLCLEQVSDDYEREQEERNERHPHVYD